MDIFRIFAVFLILFVFADVSNASMIWKLRKLVDDSPKNDTSTVVQVSPSPSPEPDDKKSDPKLTSNDPDGSNNSASVNSSPPPRMDTKKNNNDTKGSNGTESVSQPPQNHIDEGRNEDRSNITHPVSPSPQTPTKNVKNDEESHKDVMRPPPPQSKNGLNNTKELANPPYVNKDDNNTSKTDDGKGSPQQSGNSETCTGLLKCTDEGTLVACIENPKTGTKEQIILVKNEGDQSLKVKIITSPFVESPLKEVEIPKHQTERVNISLTYRKNSKLILEAGHGECVLHMEPLIPKANFFLHLPSYENLVTPINGAYFLIFSFVVFGGTWTCYMCRKRERQGEVPYQELEMGLPESLSAQNVETAEGWDQDWDDDWDEDNGLKSPDGQQIRNISANGLTSRTSNKDGWEDNWDD